MKTSLLAFIAAVLFVAASAFGMGMAPVITNDGTYTDNSSASIIFITLERRDGTIEETRISVVDEKNGSYVTSDLELTNVTAFDDTVVVRFSLASDNFTWRFAGHEIVTYKGDWPFDPQDVETNVLGIPLGNNRELEIRRLRIAPDLASITFHFEVVDPALPFKYGGDRLKGLKKGEYEHDGPYLKFKNPDRAVKWYRSLSRERQQDMNNIVSLNISGVRPKITDVLKWFPGDPELQKLVFSSMFLQPFDEEEFIRLPDYVQFDLVFSYDRIKDKRFKFRQLIQTEPRAQGAIIYCGRLSDDLLQGFTAEQLQELSEDGRRVAREKGLVR